MNRFWKNIILPLFNEIKPKVIVEVGCFRGDNTKNILEDYCKINNAKLKSIDPEPHVDFNPINFKKEYGDSFEYFKNLSLEIIPVLKDYDVILIDGDHNWYTVFHELKAIESNFFQDNFPFIILHDVSWPYARRDLYYNPENIPDEFRHPYEKLAMFPGIEKLGNIGLNETLNNAIYENTPRNGVLTAIEDFIDSTSLDLTFFSINVFYGLGIICQNTDENRKMILELFYESDMAGVLENVYLKERLTKDNIIKINNNKINALNKSYNDLNNKFSNLIKINENLKSQQVNLEENISSLKDNSIKLENDIFKLNSSLVVEKSLVKILNQTIVEKDEDLASLNRVIDKNNESIDVLKNDYSLLLEDNKNFLNDISSLRKKIHEINTEFSNELSQKNKCIVDLKEINENQLILNNELKKENDDLKIFKNSLLSSKSWKITLPFRKIMNFFRRFY